MWAGERLRLAGCSSGRSVCARGGWSARRGWFRCGVYVRITPAVCRIAPNRTACAVFRSYSDVGRDRHECVLELSVRLSGWAGSLWGVRFFTAIPTGEQSRRRSVGGARISCGETLRVCRNVLCSDHACCLPHSAKQDGLRCVPFLFRRVEIAIRALSRCWRGYLSWRVHFGFVRFFMAISTGLPGCGDAGTGNGAGGAAFVRFCAAALAL